MIVVKNKSLSRYNKENIRNLVSVNGNIVSVYYDHEKARYIYTHASIHIKKNDFDIDAYSDCTIIHISSSNSLPLKFVERYVSIIDPDYYLGRIKITVFTDGEKITKYTKKYEFHFITNEDRRRILEYLETKRYNLVIKYSNGKIQSIEKSKATLKDSNQ